MPQRHDFAARSAKLDNRHAMDETTRDLHRSLDLTLRVGEMLLSNGAGAADVTATMQSVAYACGLRGVSADVTFTQLTMIYHPTVDDIPVSQSRRVTHREIDYDDLTTIDHLVRDLVAGRISRDEARSRVLQIVSTGHSRPRWAVTVGWGFMGAGTALLFGGGFLVSMVAFLSSMAIDRIQRSMSVRRYPAFYQQVAGGLVATAFAVGTAVTGLDIEPSRVVTAGIIMLLAGLGIVGATQDALAGFPITANARFLEALLATAGIIAGVSGGLTVADLLGVRIGNIEPGAVGVGEVSAMTAGAAIAAAAFAFASYAPLRALAPIAGIGAVGMVAMTAGDELGLGGAWSTALAATIVGALSYWTSTRARVPSLVLVVPAVIPLLPGRALYRGLALIAEGEGGGTLQLAAAGATALALAAGVILGQYIAQPLNREARRLETRLAGPRLVGPLRVVPSRVRSKTRSQQSTRVSRASKG